MDLKTTVLFPSPHFLKAKISACVFSNLFHILVPQSLNRYLRISSLLPSIFLFLNLNLKSTSRSSRKFSSSTNPGQFSICWIRLVFPPLPLKSLITAHCVCSDRLVFLLIRHFPSLPVFAKG